jgi:hypothetical protein
MKKKKKKKKKKTRKSKSGRGEEGKEASLQMRLIIILLEEKGRLSTRQSVCSYVSIIIKRRENELATVIIKLSNFPTRNGPF